MYIHSFNYLKENIRHAIRDIGVSELYNEQRTTLRLFKMSVDYAGNHFQHFL